MESLARVPCSKTGRVPCIASSAWQKRSHVMFFARAIGQRSAKACEDEPACRQTARRRLGGGRGQAEKEKEATSPTTKSQGSLA